MLCKQRRLVWILHQNFSAVCRGEAAVVHFQPLCFFSSHPLHSDTKLLIRKSVVSLTSFHLACALPAARVVSPDFSSILRWTKSSKSVQRVGMVLRSAQHGLVVSFCICSTKFPMGWNWGSPTWKNLTELIWFPGCKQCWTLLCAENWSIGFDFYWDLINCCLSLVAVFWGIFCSEVALSMGWVLFSTS